MIRALGCIVLLGAGRGHSSIIVVVATDAPLIPSQLRQLARRASLGIGRMGGIASTGSGDLFIAFSTSKIGPADSAGVVRVPMLSTMLVDPLYEATVQGTEEAIINAMLAARTMKGADDFVVPALPHDRLREVLASHDRLRR